MPFKFEGFLDANQSSWIEKTRVTHKPWFDLADRLNREGMALLHVVEPSKYSTKELTASLLYGRALQAFQGSILLSERGMITEARTLVRSCAESAIALGGVATKEGFVDELFEDYDKHCLCIANVILDDIDCRQNLTREQIEGWSKLANELKTKYRPKKPKGIKWAMIAGKVGMTNLYITVYRIISGDAAHVAVAALHNHIKADAENNIECLTFSPSTTNLDDTLSKGIWAMLSAMEAFGHTFERKDIASIVRTLCAESDVLASGAQR